MSDDVSIPNGLNKEMVYHNSFLILPQDIPLEMSRKTRWDLNKMRHISCSLMLIMRIYWDNTDTIKKNIETPTDASMLVGLQVSRDN
jgi:hypothetical protein